MTELEQGWYVRAMRPARVAFTVEPSEQPRPGFGTGRIEEATP
jgi:hypothetical protein